MADTIREQIIQAIAAKLALVRTASGYATDCGALVLRERSRLDPEAAEIPAFVIWPGPETVVQQYGKNLCAMTVNVDAHVSLAGSEASVLKERMLGDLIKSMTNPALTPDTTGGLANQVLYTGGGGGATAEAGDETIGITTAFSIKYQTKIGDPYNQ